MRYFSLEFRRVDGDAHIPETPKECFFSTQIEHILTNPLKVKNINVTLQNYLEKFLREVSRELCQSLILKKFGEEF